jgi:hypothetical protein
LYDLAVVAAPFSPERASGVLRALVGRASQDSDNEHAGVVRSSPAAPWPLGPRTRVSSSFRLTMTSWPTAERLVRFDEALAEELFNGVLIAHPRNRRYHGSWDHDFSFEDEIANELRLCHPPFHTFPPSESFLRLAPARGLRFIGQLVDFATARWMERRWPDGPKLPSVTIALDGEQRTFAGDETVFAWSAADTGGSRVVKAMLMSVEAWLYDRGSDDLARAIAEAMNASLSVAFLGVLLDVGYRQPDLFYGPLEPLLSSARLFELARSRSGVPMPPMLIQWSFQSESAQMKAKEWFEMPHRKSDLLMLVQWLYMHRNLQWPAIDQARSKWEADAPRLHEGFRDVLLSAFDSANFHATQHDGRPSIEFRPPQRLTARLNEQGRINHALYATTDITMRAKKILNGEATADDGVIAELIESAANVESVQDGVGNFGPPPVAARCAAAAVAVVSGGAWLGENPERIKTARAWLLEPTQSPPELDEHDRPRGLGLSWDVFCSVGIVHLWKRERGDHELRRAMARLVMAPDYEAVGRLFVGVWDTADAEDDLGALINIALWFARTRFLAACAWSLRIEPAIDFVGAMDDLVQRYAMGNEQGLLSGWGDAYAAGWPNGVQSPAEWQAESAPVGVDEAYLARVFGWLPASARAEIGEHSRFVSELLDLCQCGVEAWSDRDADYPTELVALGARAAAAYAILESAKDQLQPHKLTAKVMDFIVLTINQEPGLGAAALAERIEQKLGLRVHQRTVERALARSKKKRR